MVRAKSYAARYLAGDHVAVWQKLVTLGDGVQEKSVLEDATAVVQEAIRRCKHNIELIHGRLIDLGYQFADPHIALVLAGPNAIERVAEIERQLGTLPLFLRAWYETFESVDFSQATEQVRAPTGPDVNGLGSHPAMIMRSLDWGWNAWLEMLGRDEEYRRQATFEDKPSREHEVQTRTPFLPTGGSASNCDPRGFELPSLCIDAVRSTDSGRDFYFMKELRRCFVWGGFPFCAYLAKGNKNLPWEARPNFEKLIPILTNGLLAV